MFLSEHFNKNFESIAKGKNFEERIFNLLLDAQGEGWLAELVTKTLKVFRASTCA